MREELATIVEEMLTCKVPGMHEAEYFELALDRNLGGIGAVYPDLYRLGIDSFRNLLRVNGANCNIEHIKVAKKLSSQDQDVRKILEDTIEILLKSHPGYHRYQNQVNLIELALDRSSGGIGAFRPDLYELAVGMIKWHLSHPNTKEEGKKDYNPVCIKAGMLIEEHQDVRVLLMNVVESILSRLFSSDVSYTNFYQENVSIYQDKLTETEEKLIELILDNSSGSIGISCPYWRILTLHVVEDLKKIVRDK